MAVYELASVRLAELGGGTAISATDTTPLVDLALNAQPIGDIWLPLGATLEGVMALRRKGKRIVTSLTWKKRKARSARTAGEQ